MTCYDFFYLLDLKLLCTQNENDLKIKRRIRLTDSPQNTADIFLKLKLLDTVIYKVLFLQILAELQACNAEIQVVTCMFQGGT